MSTLYTLRCVQCHKTYSEEQTVGSCLSCKNGLDVVYENNSKKKSASLHVSGNAFDFLRSANLLPCFSQELVSLNEGNTPLLQPKILRKRLGLKNLYLKFEGANPTGVFKDRGSAVEITKALEMGAKAVTCASTGNMAASVAAYCAKAKLPCYVVIPEKTPMGKLAQAIAYGARVIKVRGDYSDCVRLSVEMAKSYGFYLAGDYAFRSEGQKALAFELWQQLDKKVPDWIIVPVGCGTNLSAIFKGFQELLELRLIDRLPRFIGVQPSNVPTIVEAWRKKLKHYVPVERPSTVASAVGIGTPLDDIKVLHALNASKGYAQDASEEEILEAQKTLGKIEGIFVEPSAALPLAVLPALLDKKVVKPNDVVVGVLTGTGLKDPQSILSSDIQSPVLEPTMAELKRYFALGLTKERKSSHAGTKEHRLWTTFPSKVKLRSEVRKLFEVRLNNTALDSMYDLLKSFQEKEKIIRKGDVEYALESVLKMPEDMKRKLEVKDFSVHATQHQSSEAWVSLLFATETIASHAKGVGPVDAIIKAIDDAIRMKDKTGAKLSHYDVQINTGGTDAVVEVHLSLKAHNGQEVTGEAASPDVIVASIKAFENAYNLLDWKVSQTS